MKTILTVAGVVFATLYLSFFYLIPRWEIMNMGDMKLPWAMLIVASEDSGIEARSVLRISTDLAQEFVRDNALVPATGPAELALNHYVLHKCIHDGANEVDVDFDAASGLVRIKIGYPDHSGDKPCPAL